MNNKRKNIDGSNDDNKRTKHSIYSSCNNEEFNIVLDFLKHNDCLKEKGNNIIGSLCKEITENTQELFKYYCINNKLDEAKRLYEQTKINIHINNEYIFRTCCSNGYIEMVQWLYSLGDIDIHVCSDYAFKMSCVKGHKKIAKWLYSLGNVDIGTINTTLKITFEDEHYEIFYWLLNLCKKNNVKVNWNNYDVSIETGQKLEDLRI